MEKSSNSVDAVKHLEPISEPHAHPVDTANWFSFSTFSWISSLMFSSYRHGLNPSNIPFISHLESSQFNTNQLEEIWKEQVNVYSSDGKHKAHFGKTIWNHVRKRVLLTSIVYLTSVLVGFITPTICMRQLLRFSANPDATLGEGCLWVTLLILCEFIRVGLFTLTWALGYRTSIRLKTAAMGLTYRKLLRLGTVTDSTASTITNVIANDCNRIYEVIVTTQLAIGGPFVLILSAIYITYELGPLALVGLMVFPMFYPIQYLLAKGSGICRRNAVHIQDARITFVSQALHYLKFLKMFAWEKYFRNIIGDTRLSEKKFIQRAQFLLSMSVVIAPTLPHIGAIITFLLYINSGHNLYPAQAFCIVAIFSGRIRPSLNKLRSGLRSYFDAQIAIERLEGFTILFLFSLFGYSVRSVSQIFEFTNAFHLFTKRMESVLAIPEIHRTEYDSESPANKSIAISLNQVTIRRRVSADSQYIRKRHRKPKQVMPKFSKSDKRLAEDQSIKTVETEKLLAQSNDLEIIAFQLQSINLSIKKGSFIGICGQIGSGKSTLLEAIAGSLPVDQGTLHVYGSIAYAAQEPWIFKGTLRDNILFGEDFDSVRYYTTISSCCLVNDFGSFPLGDLTEAAENGCNLSGGQKSRISLARVLYYAGSRNLFLLDDPFAALDSRVAKTVYERVILEGLRSNKSKTIVLVTHQLQYLQDCDEILVMSDGKFSERGTHAELVARNSTLYTGLLAATSANDEEMPGIVPEDSELLECKQSDVDTDSNETIVPVKLSKKKHPQSLTGDLKSGIPWGVYKLYIDNAGGVLAVGLVAFAFALSIGSTAFSSWWLKHWFSTSSVTVMQNSTDNISTTLEVISEDAPGFALNRDIYAGLIGVILFAGIFRTLVFVFATIRASQGLHSQLLTYLFRNRLKSSEKIGIGQLLTLFSKDMEQVDLALPNTLEFFLQNVCIVISIFVLVTLVFPVFLIPLLVLSAIFIIIRRVYNAAIRDLKRLESEAKAPIFTKVEETVSGIATIRAFSKEEQTLRCFDKLSDEYHSIFYTFNAAVRWLSFRLDCLAVSVTGITAILILIFHGKVDGSSAGLALAYAAQLSGIFQFTVRLATETQSRFISVERMRNFLLRSNPEEPELFECNTSGRPERNSSIVADKIIALQSWMDVHRDWPSRGHVKFDSVYMSYSLEHEVVLKDLSFEALPGQKIGIIGRTGSGKSSIGSALFRLTEIKSGTISIDGIDIADVPLSKLRNTLCIIPQDPAVFQQSIRFNLDPSRSFSDAELWTVLDKTGLKSSVESLDAEVGLSQGQRQLLSIARALLRRATVLFVDEATSAIDNETSAAIDRLLAEEFTNSTIFIIAHRLKSLSYCDHLLIMDNGQARDFGPVGAITKKSEFTTYFEKFDPIKSRRSDGREP